MTMQQSCYPEPGRDEVALVVLPIAATITSAVAGLLLSLEG